MITNFAFWRFAPDHLVAAGLFADGSTSLGKWVFIGALALLLLWLVFMPKRLIEQKGRRVPWWRNVRLWAIVICVIQIWVYWQFA